MKPGQGELHDANGENFAVVWTQRNHNSGFIERQVIDGYGNVNACLGEIRQWWDMSEIAESNQSRMTVEIVFPGGGDLRSFEGEEQHRTVSYRLSVAGTLDADSYTYLADAESAAFTLADADTDDRPVDVLRYDGARVERVGTMTVTYNAEGHASGKMAYTELA